MSRLTVTDPKLTNNVCGCQGRCGSLVGNFEQGMEFLHLSQMICIDASLVRLDQDTQFLRQVADCCSNVAHYVQQTRQGWCKALQSVQVVLGRAHLVRVLAEFSLGHDPGQLMVLLKTHNLAAKDWCAAVSIIIHAPMINSRCKICMAVRRCSGSSKN